MTVVHCPGDLTHFGPNDYGIVAHQINPRVMGPTLALALAKAYPWCAKDFYSRNGRINLGDVILSKHPESTSFYIAHCCGQLSTSAGANNTDYAAVELYLKKLKMLSSSLGLPVYIPYLLGCGMAGGDWNIVSRKIETIWDKSNLVINIIKYSS